MMTTTLRRAGAAVAGTCAVIASALVIGSGSSSAAVDGSLTITPGSGTDQDQIVLTTSGPCANPNATNVSAKMYGAGFPTNGQNVVSNSPISAYSKTASGGYQIPLAQNMRDFAAMQNPPATLSGRYDITLICRTNTSLTSLGEFTGALTFTSPNAYTAAGASASPSASASASAPPSTSPSASASTSPSTSPSASASASASASPTPSASATLSRSPSPSATPSATPLPSRSASLPPLPAMVATAVSRAPSAVPAPGTLTVVDADGLVVTPDATLVAGARLTITATGFRPGEVVRATLFSTPRAMGGVAASAEGFVSYVFVVPADLELGPHRLELAGADQTVEVPFIFARADAAQVTSAQASSNGGTRESLPRTGIHLTSLAVLGAGLIFIGSKMLVPPRYVGAHRRR